jgi:hypothetical protein
MSESITGRARIPREPDRESTVNIDLTSIN